MREVVNAFNLSHRFVPRGKCDYGEATRPMGEDEIAMVRVMSASSHYSDQYPGRRREAHPALSAVIK